MSTLVNLKHISAKGRDKWIDRAVSLLIDVTDRIEANTILNQAREDWKERAPSVIKAARPDWDQARAERHIEQLEDELITLNRVILHRMFPYTPEYQPGVVPPKGGPYDLTPDDRFYAEQRYGGTVRDGQLTLSSFKGNRKHVTVSVEGFDKPQKLKTKVIENERQSWLPSVFGYVVIDDVEYVFAPSTNDLVRYSDEEKIDEGKAWRMVGEPEPLDKWQLERRARTAKRRATQLTKAEKAYLDDYLFNMIKDWEEARERNYQELYKAAEGTYWQYDLKRGPAITIPIMVEQIHPYRFKWPGEPSEKAKSAFSYNTRYGQETFSASMIRNSLNRLLRKELISKGDTARGEPNEYWIREPYDG